MLRCNTQDLQTLNRGRAGVASDLTIIAQPEHGVWFDAVPGESAMIRIPSDLVGGRYTIMEHDIAPQAGRLLHSHVEEQASVVLDGVITVVHGDDRFEATAGTIVVIPAGAVHTWADLSGKRARMRTMFTPGSIEKLFSNVVDLGPHEFVPLDQSFAGGIRPQMEHAHPARHYLWWPPPLQQMLIRSTERIASNILPDRLKSLTALGMLTRADDPTHKQKVIYSFTEIAIGRVPTFSHLGD